MNTRSIILSLIGGLAVLLLVYFFVTRDKGLKYQWYHSFRHDSDQPYGAMLIKKTLEENYIGTTTLNEKQPIHKLLEGSSYDDGKTDYVLIGESIHLDDRDVAEMKRFMNSGNDIFIAAMAPPEALMNEIYESDCSYDGLKFTYEVDSVIYANFYHEDLKSSKDYEFRYRLATKDVPYAWRSVDPKAVCSYAQFSPLGYQQNERVNFLRFRHGDGNLYLHTSPLMFTNFFLIQKDKMEYASSVFSHMSGENLIWDEVSKIPFSDLDDPYDSPLYYILQQPALKYAWWMLLVGALLYIIFASKRTQRVIPVLEPKTNTSLEFLNVISSLHYQNPNHLDMARKKMKYFLYFIRAKYGINTNAFTEDHAKRLAEKAKVDPVDTQTIYDRYKVIENYSLSNDEPERLVGLYQAIDKFYKTCK